MPSQVEIVCSCGRGYVHCPKCGRRNPYYKKFESANLSVLEGKEVRAYRCSCGTEFTNGDQCTLQPRRKAEAVTQENMILGSEAHARLLSDWVVEMQRKNKTWDAVRVYIEAQKAGWHLEAFGDKLDPDVKQALIDRGLWPEQVTNNQVEAPMRGAQDTQSPPITAPSEVTLEDIIKNLQENS
jgi:hypothetical protein